MNNQGHEYPLYAEPPSDRDKVTTYLVVVSFLVAALGYAFVHRDKAEFFRFWTIVSASSPLWIFAALNWLMDHVLWKQAWFARLVGLFQVPLPPNLSGDYKVIVSWHAPHPDAGENAVGKSDATITVIQSWRKISIMFVFAEPGALSPKAESTSRTAYIDCKADPRRVSVVYTYSYTEASPRSSDGSVRKNRIHGTCNLVFQRQPNGAAWQPYGDYYSDDNGSGTIQLRV